MDVLQALRHMSERAPPNGCNQSRRRRASTSSCWQMTSLGRLRHAAAAATPTAAHFTDYIIPQAPKLAPQLPQQRLAAGGAATTA